MNSDTGELRAQVGDWFEEDDLFWTVTDAPGADEQMGADKKQAIQFEQIIDTTKYYVNGILVTVA